MKYHSVIKKNKMMPFASWMDLKVVIRKASKKKERQISYDIIYM